jgi:peptide/nickel transport system substrate-binding protein
MFISHLARWAAVLASVIVSGPALAQKAKDTLRMSANDVYAVLSPVDMALEEAGQIYEQIYMPLMSVEERTGKWVPEMATAWRRVDPLTLDFDLREGVTLHSGKHFTADDIKAAIDYAIDPKTKIRSKNRYTWVKSAEKLGPHKLRVHLVEPNALDLLTFASRFYVVDSDIMSKLDNKADYGRVSAASAGPYKLVSMDRNKGSVVERFDKLHPALTHRRAPIRRIEVIAVPDRQAQIAEMLTGGLDLLRNVPEDAAKELAKMPNVAITPVKSSSFIYLMMDAIGRSGRKELTDARVRKAIVMAIDKEKIAKEIVPGGSEAEMMDAICFPFTLACDPSTKPYGYDPASAKKLMAEAGYPNGFEMTLYVHQPVRDIAVAIAGYLQEIGIKMSVSQQTISGYIQLREDGKLAAFVGFRPTGNFPETSEILDSFFTGSRDYWNDPIIAKAMDEGAAEADNAKRGRLLRPALDRTNREAYILPISSMPWVFAHTKEVRVDTNQLRANAVQISDIFWK